MDTKKYNLLDNINSPEDVRGLEESRLPELCSELRDFLIDNVALTGGHLASNLGAVELTVALHRVYDSSRDRIIFDVGHQSYVHKILTGRKEKFSTLRSLGGIAGFPKPSESVDDAFISGHASTSISVALGMARARTLRNEDYSVVAVIGDGALTGGLAYEGLSNAGASGEALTVILNDNGMSIAKNVGGIASFLSKSRVRPGYLNFKRNFRKTVGKIPPLYNLAHNIKEKVKRMFLGGGIFDELGFYYLGPVDGHDVAKLEASLRWARELKMPVLLHVMTQKGKGYKFAEESPDLYHGVSTFDREVGITAPPEKDFSSVFGSELCALAREDDNIVAITAAMTAGTGLSGFASQFPKRFFDVGIAEEHAVTMAAAMAKQGEKPVVAIYSSFLQRSYDMLIHDVALQGLHVVLAVDRAGIVGRDGETHNGVFDLSFLTAVPNMAIFCPSSFAELEEMLNLAVNRVDGPVAIRYPRGGEGLFNLNTASKPLAVLREGEEVCIISYGIMINQCVGAAASLEEKGLSVKLIKLNLINPLDLESVAEMAAGCKAVLVAEDVCAAGCVGVRLLAAAAEKGISIGKTKLVNLGNGIVQHGSIEQLYKKLGLDAEGLAQAAEDLLRQPGEDDITNLEEPQDDEKTEA